MKIITLLCVGKLKSPELEKLEAEYLKRISNFKLNIVETKAQDDDCEAEAMELLKKIQTISSSKNNCIILLTEQGKKFDSPNFSKFIFEKLENFSEVFLVINGAAGPGTELVKRAHVQISLSELTFPHKLARLILIEQLYRAETIQARHPYHK
jgi:23S rRNA (pseudouridine1915-N3)-methyltransferase